MKTTVFLVDKEKKNEVADLLEKNDISFSYNDRLKLDFRTAIIVFPIAVGLTLLAIYFR